MVDPNALVTFTLVAEHLNFTAVADRRNTVQSAVSAQVKKLEAATGKTLVSRGRGEGMSLTPEGEAFLVYARRILALSQEALASLDTAGRPVTIRLGTTVTLAMSVVSDVLRAFAFRHTGVQIEIMCNRSDALLAHLDRGDIDVAFMMDQGRHVGRSFVHSQPLVWVGSGGFELDDSDSVPLAFLSDGRDLRRYALAALDEAGRSGRVTHLSQHPIGVRAFVQSGLAVTVMPQISVVPPLEIISDDANLPALTPIALAAYTREGRLNPEISDLLGLLEDAVT
ncbi:MAG: LysR family transcriptional regulator [Pseudomonadota bacterium]